MTSISKVGGLLAGAYLLLSVYLITTQGLFGESFIALLLGLPWSLIFVSFEFGGVSGPLLYVMILAPIGLNLVILYGVGALLQRWSKRGR